MEPKIGGKNPENRWNFLENAPIRKKNPTKFENEFNGRISE